MNPLIPAEDRGLYGIGPWIEVTYKDKTKSAFLVNREVHINKDSMIESYTIQIVTVTRESLEKAKLDR